MKLATATLFWLVVLAQPNTPKCFCLGPYAIGGSIRIDNLGQAWSCACQQWSGK